MEMMAFAKNDDYTTDIIWTTPVLDEDAAIDIGSDDDVMQMPNFPGVPLLNDDVIADAIEAGGIAYEPEEFLHDGTNEPDMKEVIT